MNEGRIRAEDTGVPIENATILTAIEGLPNPTALLDGHCRTIGANSAWDRLGIPDLQEAIRNDDLSPEEQEGFRASLDAVFTDAAGECVLGFPPGTLTMAPASIVVRRIQTETPAAIATIRITRGGEESAESLEQEADSRPAIFETDLEGHIVRWSSSAEQLFDRTEEEILSRHASFLFAKRGLHFPDDDLLAGLSKGRTERMELRLKRGSRSFFDGEIIVGMRDGKDGRWLSCEANLLSERQRAGALRRSEERLRYALEAASDGIWDWNIRTDRVVFTPRVSEILGSDAGGEGMRSTDIDSWNARIHPEDAAEHQASLAAHFAGTVPAFESEYRLRTDDDRWKWVQVRGRVTERRANNSPARMIGTITDISERKFAQDALKQSEEQYRNLFEHASDTVILFDVGDTLILDANHKAGEMFGYSASQLKSMTVHHLHPEDHWLRLDRALQSSDARTGTLFELDGLTRTKNRIPLEINVRLVKYGSRLVYQSFIRDISERRTLEMQLRQSHKMETVGRLAGGIAHDFNNILTAIQGYTSLLQASLPEGSEERDMASEVTRAVQRASRLTTQLLTFSRRDVSNPSLIGLNSVVQDMEQMLRQLIGEHVELVNELHPGLAQIYSDSGAMEQVITNLVVNAADSMPNGGTLTIRTDNVTLDEDAARRSGEAEPGHYVLLSVGDQGEGIDPRVLPQIFEPFFTTKSAGTGTGLGLSTVYGIVKRCHGHIEVDSKPGRGTEFRIYLPRSVRVEAEVVVPEAAPKVESGNETVLVVEDEPAVRDLARRFLETNGYTVVEAGGAAEAIEAAEIHKGEIDLLLTDVIMPELSGPELAKRLREQQPGLKVLYMSGYPGEFIERHGVSEQERGYLRKPFSQESLALKTREVLDG